MEILHSIAHHNVVDPLEPEDTLFNSVDDDGQRDDLAFGTFENKRPSISSIHGHANTKVAEVVIENQRNLIERVNAGISGMVNVKVNLNIPGLLKLNISHRVEKYKSAGASTKSTKSIGTITISHPRIATDLQIGIVVIYLTLLLYSALTGPKALFLMVWRMGTVLSVYTVILHHLGWKGDARRDVLLSPLCHISLMVLEFVGRMIEKEVLTKESITS